ncbi:hypothetical protein Z043_100249 [Scleropages formosus]|uniref:Uncharacterized protein n=1 Tax=Scleropages formosus TaxID=113540 RepID=A0A0P7W130_SCLFO|nr:hypothetical protein Z043_100249 [Scleropages formosus]
MVPQHALTSLASESCQKFHSGQAHGSHSSSLLVPLTLSDSLLSRAASAGALCQPYSLRPEGGASLERGVSGETSLPGLDPDRPVSPQVIMRRRGGLIEQRDIIMAHQAHKIQSTPQARRKEWEMALHRPRRACTPMGEGRGGEDILSGVPHPPVCHLSSFRPSANPSLSSPKVRMFPTLSVASLCHVPSQPGIPPTRQESKSWIGGLFPPPIGSKTERLENVFLLGL